MYISFLCFGSNAPPSSGTILSSSSSKCSTSSNSREYPLPTATSSKTSTNTLLSTLSKREGQETALKPGNKMNTWHGLQTMASVGWNIVLL